MNHHQKNNKNHKNNKHQRHHRSRYKNDYRKVYLINPKFQLKFAVYLCLMAAFVISIYYMANWYFLNSFIEKGQDVGLPSNHIYFQFIADQARFMHIIFAVSSFCAFFALTVIGIWLSHRVAGPLHRLHKHMVKVTKGGKLTKVKFRKKDYFPEIAKAYNLQVDALEKKYRFKENDHQVSEIVVEGHDESKKVS